MLTCLMVKTKILIFFIFLFFPQKIYADTFNWTKIVTTIDNTTEFYIDKKSVRKVGNFHYYWLMANYLKLEEGDDPNVRSNITFNILNCKTSEFKTVTHTSFNKKKAKGAIDIDVIVPDTDMDYFVWRHYAEDTSFGYIFREVCKIR